MGGRPADAGSTACRRPVPLLSCSGAAMRIYLVRHGQVPSNRDLRYVGTTDEQLTDLGERQADALGEAFRDVRLDAVWASPRLRARQTAERIVAAHPGGDALLAEERDLAEQDFGQWEGLRPDQVRDLGAEMAAKWRAFQASADVAPPGGESMTDLCTRIEGLIERANSEGIERLMLVSHVGPIKVALAAILKMPLEHARRFFLDPGTFSVLESGERPFLCLFNAPGHRGWLASRWMKDHRLE